MCMVLQTFWRCRVIFHSTALCVAAEPAWSLVIEQDVVSLSMSAPQTSGLLRGTVNTINSDNNSFDCKSLYNNLIVKEKCKMKTVAINSGMFKEVSWKNKSYASV